MFLNRKKIYFKFDKKKKKLIFHSLDLKNHCKEKYNIRTLSLKKKKTQILTKSVFLLKEKLVKKKNTIFNKKKSFFERKKKNYRKTFSGILLNNNFLSKKLKLVNFLENVKNEKKSKKYMKSVLCNYYLLEKKKNKKIIILQKKKKKKYFLEKKIKEIEEENIILKKKKRILKEKMINYRFYLKTEKKINRKSLKIKINQNSKFIRELENCVFKDEEKKKNLFLHKIFLICSENYKNTKNKNIRDLIFKIKDITKDLNFSNSEINL